MIVEVKVCLCIQRYLVHMVQVYSLLNVKLITVLIVV